MAAAPAPAAPAAAAAAAAESSEHYRKRQNTAHLDYKNLVRFAASVANWESKFADAGIRDIEIKDTNFSRKSKRVAALFRFLRQFATKLKSKSIKDLFAFVRCSVRFADTAMISDESKDAEAMIAGSDEDNLMIKLVEECVKEIGYYMLRALVDIRTMGSPTAKGLGLYALLCSNDTLHDYIGLVYSHYTVSQLCLHKVFASGPIFQYELNDQASYIKKFMKLGYVGPSDLLLSDLNPYPAKYEPLFYIYEKTAETHIFETYGEWPDYIRFVRMIKQATKYAPVKSPMPKPGPGPPNETKEAKKIREDSENLEIAAKYNIIGLEVLEIQLVKQSEFDLDDSLDAGSSLFTTALKILQNFSSVLKINDIPETFKVLQGSFIRRVLTMECVQLEFCFEKLPGRTDAKQEVLLYCGQVLRKSLDRVVVSAAKGKD